MAFDVWIFFFVKNPIQKIFFTLSFLIIAACGGDDSSDSSSQSVTWNATVEGNSGEMKINSQQAVSEPDGGVVLTLTGLFNSDTATFTMDIAGGANIQIEPPAAEALVHGIQVGSSSVNTTLDINSVKYRGTSGSVTFTAYDTNVGGTVSGSLNIGMVKLELGSNDTASLQGDFTATVSTPSS